MMATNSTDSKQLNQGQWNVQGVREKVTTKCLWNACKALGVGLFLMAVGASMAVVGYYADHLSVQDETRGNSTIRVKNENRVLHLNNLSYAGPVIMGIGGFIVVAACVMTFEARDSAAKVVPARFKPSTNSSDQLRSAKSTLPSLKSLQRLDSKINSSCQTPLAKAGYKLNNIGSEDRSPPNNPFGRKMLTSAFVQFSRALIEKSALEGLRRNGRTSETNLNKSSSAPNLCFQETATQKFLNEEQRNYLKRGYPKTDVSSRGQPLRSLDQCTLLSTQLLQRQALSMDSPFCDAYRCYTPPHYNMYRHYSRKSESSQESLHMALGASAGVSGSQASMTLDIHECRVTIKVKDESQTRRSDMSRRHQLLRQRPVEEDRESPCRRFKTQVAQSCTSDDLFINRPHSNSPRSKVHKFSRSQSCMEQEKNIYFIEDHKSKKYRSVGRLTSPQRTLGYGTQGLLDPSRSFLHTDEVLSCQIRKNEMRKKSSHKMGGNSSNEDKSRMSSKSKSSSLRSPSPTRNGSSALVKRDNTGFCSLATLPHDVREIL